MAALWLANGTVTASDLSDHTMSIVGEESRSRTQLWNDLFRAGIDRETTDKQIAL